MAAIFPGLSVLILDVCSEIKLPKLLPHLPGASKLVNLADYE